MPKRTCSVPTCDLPHNAQGFCRSHYRRYQQHGSPLADKPLRKLPKADERDDVVARIMRRSKKAANGCIEWQGFILESGYGTISWRHHEWVVHRAMWTAVVGEIPTDDDWTIDHLCSNRRCVNVGHLEVVTRTENSMRGGGLLIAQRNNAQRRDAETHCRHGHEWTADNTGRTDGKRYCRQCKRNAWARTSASINAKRRAARATLAG